MIKFTEYELTFNQFFNYKFYYICKILSNEVFRIDNDNIWILNIYDSLNIIIKESDLPINIY